MAYQLSFSDRALKSLKKIPGQANEEDYAQIIQSEGEPKFAVIAYEEYEALQKSLAPFDSLEDFLDYANALKVKSEITSWHSPEEIKCELAL